MGAATTMENTRESNKHTHRDSCQRRQPRARSRTDTRRTDTAGSHRTTEKNRTMAQRERKSHLQHRTDRTISGRKRMVYEIERQQQDLRHLHAGRKHKAACRNKLERTPAQARH